MEGYEITITIIHNPEYGSINKREILSDIRQRFKETTGYDVETIKINRI